MDCGVLFFVTGAAAFAFDTSGAFGAAHQHRRYLHRRELARDEWCHLTVTLPPATYVHSSGNSVSLDARYGDVTDWMLIEITQTSFGKTIGVNTITITQEAACGGQSVRDGLGMLPIGALAGPWSGDFFDCAAKSTGKLWCCRTG